MTRRGDSSELLIRQQLQRLARALPAAREGDADRLHEARVATRRLRERLPLVAPKAAGHKLLRKVRRLSRALGPARELDVALRTLDELCVEGDVPPAVFDELKALMREERERLYAGMIAEIARVDVEKLRRRAVAVARRRKTAKDGEPACLGAAQARAARRAVRLRAAMENAAGLYLPDRLHEVRIAVKKLRYSLELVREIQRSRAQARIQTLRTAQDLLGRMHDLEVLIGRVRAVQGTAGSLQFSAGLDTLVRRLETECRQLHAQYMARRKKITAVCDHTVSAAQAPAGDRESSAA